MHEKIAEVASNTSYLASGSVATLGVLSLHNFAIIFGMILGFATFALNWVYRQKYHTLMVSQTKLNKEQD